ncbi:hypothetical protein ACFYWU_23570 [Streptomyces chrestomyceticus]|uniref:hypothetical protein n=1 Tax=Streptomyces chrestomyceticus TaxID=68185 RepID=UPI0019D2B11B|nr:hypothetical protein [Streptomyces chrestomyceticus]
MTFSTSIGEVTLGDVGSGCFVHPAHEVVRRLTEEGTVRLPGAGGPLGVVFASDGGLPQFLDLLHRSVLRFLRTGELGYP